MNTLVHTKSDGEDCVTLFTRLNSGHNSGVWFKKSYIQTLQTECWSMELEFTESEFSFLIKVFSELQAGNPNGDFGNYVKIIEYAKLNKRPELLYYYFYHYFEPLLTTDTDDFQKSFSDEEKPLMKSVWKKFEVLKKSYGELTEEDLLVKFGIDLNRLFLDLGIHWKPRSHAH